MENLVNNLLNEQVKLGTIDEQKIVLKKPFPLVLKSEQPMNFIQLQEYFIKNNKDILKAASEYGAVMFKNFDVKNAEEFASIIYQSGGAAVRKLIVGNEQRMFNPQILTTNESPPSEPIPFHHELAQTPNPPSHICFYCLNNQAVGGSTPILRSDQVFYQFHQVYNYLNENHQQLLQKFETLQVKYIKIVPEEDDVSSALGRSWKSMFNVKTKQEAETFMNQNNYTFEWLQNNDCKIITQKLPAVIQSSNGNKTFFNQVIAAYTGWKDKRNDPKKAVIFGDGQELPQQEIDQLVQFMNENSIVFKWENGDFLIIDNTVAYHSRQSFDGDRKILACIANNTKQLQSQQTHLVLSSGDIMPSLGFGMWKVEKQICQQVTFQAIKSGYRLIDEACDYGNEKECGDGIQQALKEKIVTRDQLFVTSKLWNTYHRKEHVKLACLKTLKDLQLDYLDLYLIHFPISLKFVPFEERYPPEWFHDPNAKYPKMVEDLVPMQETWQAMEDLVKEGLVRNIGLCNVGTVQLRDILSYAKIKPSVLQIELHPYNQQLKLLKFCREKSIQVTGFSNLGVSSYLQFGLSKDLSFLENKSIVQISQKYNKTSAQVILRWAIQRGTAIIPKTVNQDRMIENLSLFDFNLTNDEMKEIGNLEKGQRFNDPGNFCEQGFNTFYPIYE